jgi:hypothetical protein
VVSGFGYWVSGLSLSFATGKWMGRLGALRLAGGWVGRVGRVGRVGQCFLENGLRRCFARERVWEGASRGKELGMANLF